VYGVNFVSFLCRQLLSLKFLMQLITELDVGRDVDRIWRGQ
jgi:hypothetical protein